MAIIRGVCLPGQGNRVKKFREKIKGGPVSCRTGYAFKVRERMSDTENVSEGLWWESGSTHLVKVECKAFFTMGNRLRAIETLGSQGRKRARILRNIFRMSQVSGLRHRTVDYYKLLWFAQQKMLTNCPAATSGFQNWSGVRRSANAGCALCSWAAARAVLTGIVNAKS